MVDPFYQRWRRAVYSRTDQVNQSVPEQYGDLYKYYSKQIHQSGKAGYFGFYRQHIETKKHEKVLDLKDFKQISRPHEAFLDKIKLSDDHDRLCFNVDINNDERLRLGVLDINKQKPIDWIDNWCQAEFDKSGEYLYYVEADKLNRPCKIIKRRVGDPNSDKVLHTDDDPTHYLDIGISKDKRYFIFTCGHGSVYVIDRENNTDHVYTLAESEPGTRIFADHIRVNLHFF